MTIVLPALATTFAAFCVWQMVRIINRRETWAKWTAVCAAAVGIPLLYFAVYAEMLVTFRIGDGGIRYTTMIYRVPFGSQQAWESFFGLANHLDRMVRPEFWVEKSYRRHSGPRLIRGNSAR
jgi:hypothetical protein